MEITYFWLLILFLSSLNFITNKKFVCQPICQNIFQLIFLFRTFLVFRELKAAISWTDEKTVKIDETLRVRHMTYLVSPNSKRNKTLHLTIFCHELRNVFSRRIILKWCSISSDEKLQVGKLRTQKVISFRHCFSSH